MDGSHCQSGCKLMPLDLVGHELLLIVLYSQLSTLFQRDQRYFFCVNWLYSMSFLISCREYFNSSFYCSLIYSLSFYIYTFYKYTFYEILSQIFVILSYKYKNTKTLPVHSKNILHLNLGSFTNLDLSFDVKTLTNEYRNLIEKLKRNDHRNIVTKNINGITK